MLSTARTIAAALPVFMAAAMCTGQAWPRDLPDPTLTPGVLNPQVTPSTIKTTICKRGWTKTVRPPVTYTDNLKLKQIAQYGYADKNPTHYEEDHFTWRESFRRKEPVAATPDGTVDGSNERRPRKRA
jgi:hypothetical protein